MKHIRNFCIIAHIDHGKSTLADCLLEATGTITQQHMRSQLLDNMELERERGITIKSHAIQMRFLWQEKKYTLNLIDTPGHVDFSYEVSRAIAACEGALLVVDASQGIEAQTLANLHLALEQNLTVIPVINKIDLPHARTAEIVEELIDLIGCDEKEVISTSAKDKIGIDELLEAIVTRIPPPEGNASAPLQAMVFDAVYNPFKGVAVYYRLFNGTLSKGDIICFLQGDKNYRTEEIGILRYKPEPVDKLTAGQVGYVLAAIKNPQEVKIGATFTHPHQPCSGAIKGFSAMKPMLFASIYPVSSNDYEVLRENLMKLQLNDPALVWEPENSAILGFGFRCGFLGLLHMEIVQERLSREFYIEIIITLPSVQFKVIDKKQNEHMIQSPASMPESNKIAEIQEPIMRTQIITKVEFVGSILQMCIHRRGVLLNQVYLTTQRVELVFHIPLLEIVFDFFDKLKAISKGYASLDYSLAHFVSSDLVKLDILLNGEKVDALSTIVHRSKAQIWGKKFCHKLKELLPQHLFEIPIQAAIGVKIIARETVKALRKDVIAKLYGGDVTRKKKLQEKQKKGKKRMRQVGKVNVPQEAFLAMLQIEN